MITKRQSLESFVTQFSILVLPIPSHLPPFPPPIHFYCTSNQKERSSYYTSNQKERSRRFTKQMHLFTDKQLEVEPYKKKSEDFIDLRGWQEVKILGQGTYGQVFEMKPIGSQQTFAVKKVPHEKSDGVQSSTLREISLMQHLHHPNIVRLISVEDTNRYMYMIMEKLDVDLQQAMEEFPLYFTPQNVKILMYQILRGLCHCHSKHIAHRDLKPSNIMLDERLLNLKLGDFGLARKVNMPMNIQTTEVITLWYRPPELLLGTDQYGLEVDIWSAAMIWTEMLRAGHGFEHRSMFAKSASDIDQIIYIFNMFGYPSEREWPEIKQLPYFQDDFPKFVGKQLEEIVPGLDSQGYNLLKNMLIYRPKDRISARKALQHPYFDDIRNN
eukprot:TRINITY_DN9969_c0_g1_i1.p2 TRINITY_DN9969_c0_g1~~TRINITY_DN9969_c0_g1_i1.p2  ORF type:complete len:384 (+),score=18.80 TRINITY_DN9969_c0_g1_i1:2-1153(+)